MQVFNQKPYPIERILAAASYLTAGGVGIVWMILAAILKKNITKFLLYHIFQCFFLILLFVVVSYLGKMVYVILYRIPLINVIPYLLNMPLPFLMNFSIIQAFTTTIMFYLAITAGLGYYSYLPWVSNIIKINLRMG